LQSSLASHRLIRFDQDDLAAGGEDVREKSKRFGFQDWFTNPVAATLQSWRRTSRLIR
jgi:hypothetical protein